MRRSIKGIIITILLVLTLPALTSCESEPKFSITFIDVGQGDAALVSCEDHYMLIDGGPKGAGGKVYEVLENNNIKTLDYLIISHMHEDHIGGLKKALMYISAVGRTFSNETDDDSDEYFEFHKELLTDGCSSIEIPNEGDVFELGSATIEIIYVGNPNIDENESLVVLVTYGKTNFLFTGDINYKAEGEIAEKYHEKFPVTLLKVAHHGAKDGVDTDDSTETRFVRATMPKYAIISVGDRNRYGHPTERVLRILGRAGAEIYRTDINGTITVTSNGETLSFNTEK